MIEEFEPRKDDPIKKAWEFYAKMLNKQARAERNRMIKSLSESAFKDKKPDWDLELKALPRR